MGILNNTKDELVGGFGIVCLWYVWWNWNDQGTSDVMTVESVIPSVLNFCLCY